MIAQDVIWDPVRLRAVELSGFEDGLVLCDWWEERGVEVSGIRQAFEVVGRWVEQGEEWYPTGSLYVGGFDVEDSDVDFFSLRSSIPAEDVTLDGSFNQLFRSTRFGRLNLIAMDDAEYFEAYRRVNEEIRALNMVFPNKAERIACFRRRLRKWRS